MEDIKEMFLWSANKDVKRNLKLAEYLYKEIRNDENAEQLDEFVALIKDSFDRDKPAMIANPAATATPRRKFDSKILQGFYIWLCNEGLRETTCYDYCRRLIKITKAETPPITIEDLACGKVDIQVLIDKYSQGGEMWEENNRQHNAPSSALKKFKAYLDSLTFLPGGVLKSADFIPYLEDDDEENCYDEDELDDDLSDRGFVDVGIFLRETEGDMPFEIKVKHCSEIMINNRQCKIVYKENGAVCNEVSKVINVKNYSALIQLMLKYYSILNEDRTPAAVAVPFGGAHTYEYEFDGKSNYSRSHKLFDNPDRYFVEQALDEYNKIIADIIAQ